MRAAKNWLAMLLMATAVLGFAVAQNSEEIDVSATANPDEFKVDSDKNVVDPNSATITITMKPHEEVRIDADVALIIDTSSSMNLADPEFKRKISTKRFIDLLDPQRDLVGVLLFNDNTSCQSGLTNDFNRAKHAIDAIPEPDKLGGTDIGMALLAAINLLDSSPRANDTRVSHSIVLLTDGCPEKGNCITPESCLNISDLRLLDLTRQRGYRVYIVHIGACDLASEPLQQISQQTNGLFVPAISYNLYEVYEALSQIIPHPILASNTTIIDILPPYLHPDPSSYEIIAPGISDLYTKNNLFVEVNGIDDTTTIKYHWGPIVARSGPLSLMYRVKFENHLPIHDLTDSNRTELVPKIIYRDINGVQRDKVLPPADLRIKSNCIWCIWSA